MSRNSRSEQRKTELIKQQSLIEQKKIEISKKIQAKELLEKYKSQTNRSELLPNDGSFLENFKRLTGSSSSTNEISASSSSSSSHTVPLQLNAIPSLSLLEFEQQHHNNNSNNINNHQQQQQQHIELNDIPTPRELDLSLIPKPSSFKLDEICMPPLIEGSKIKVPKSRAELIELVSANGDGYEENLVIKCNKDELDPLLRFIFDKNCTEYLEYRREVMERRRGDKYDPLDELQYEDYKKAPSMMLQGPKTFGFHYSQQTTQEKVAKTVTTIRNDDSESTNSDTETWNSMKERNLKNLKRKAIHSRSRKQQDASTTDSSDDNIDSKDDRRYKMSSAASTSSSNSKKSGDQCEQNQLEQQQQQLDQSNANSDKTSESSSRPPKRKKSRWSEGPVIQTVVVPPPVTSSSILPAPTTIAKLATVTRSDPALLNYARQNFGTTSLTEEDWKKAEEHYKINLLFQDMQRKRQEIDQLAKNGKFKYEYDSDEDVNGGTWEHKMRTQEMEATLKWAEALNKQCHGKHHIGDFLPPEELKKFMEKYQAQKDPSRLPDVSDYKEFKLKEDNIGYQMLQKLGWKGEGTSLGVSGSGITEPINKAAPRENLQGLGANEVEAPNENDNEYEIYRKRMMLAYRFRPNPLV
ncbi:SURP and G-patch domain-containing protein 1 isoform X2 [Chironomus tepperi]|uniref:SURP and G-patch domain-containing protein 1 isoform X2 n=1 Tax=Chironomus tepperi TaxID=113505 RepID=UPI00391F4264